MKTEKEYKSVVSRLNELEKSRDLSDHEKEESLRGTDKFGKTKTMVGAQPK